MSQTKKNEGFTGPVNIGNPEEFSILELAHKIIELTGSKSKIVYKALPQDGDNTNVIAIEGNFDDAQTGVNLNWTNR